MKYEIKNRFSGSTKMADKLKSDKEILDFMEDHLIDWDPGMGAYISGFPPVHGETLREIISNAIDDANSDGWRGSENE